MGAEALVTQFNPRNVGNVSGTAYGRPKREFHLQFHRIGFGPADYDWAPHQLRTFITSVVATGLLSRRNHFGTPSEYSGVRVVAAHHQTELDATDPVEYVSRKQ